MISNRIAGGVLLLAAIWYGLQATRFQSRLLSDPVGPQAVPLGLAVTLGLLAVWLILVAPREPRPDWPARGFWLPAIAMIASFIGYAYLIEPLGYLLATALEAAFLALLFGARPLAGLATGAGVSGALYATFAWGFDLTLPGGFIARLLGLD